MYLEKKETIAYLWVHFKQANVMKKTISTVAAIAVAFAGLAFIP